MDYLTTRAGLLSAKLPKDTRTYGAVSHGSLMKTVEDCIKDNGHEIKRVEHRGAISHQIMVTNYTLKSPLTELSPMISVMNSYNKSKSVTLANGALVEVCLNGMIAGRDISVSKRKHSKNVRNDIEGLVEQSIANVNDSFDKIKLDIDLMSNKKLDGITEISHILGELHLRDEVITTNQMSRAINEVRYSKNWSMDEEDDKRMTAWYLYNNVTEALKSSHPMNEIASFGEVHDYFMDYVSV